MTFLVHLLIVLVVAKAAAELSERVGVPAVVGEILAGIIVGPSALGLLPQDEVLTLLGGLGVILLLLDVGMEMDLGELASVGRAALTVAVVGVVAPFALGAGVILAFGLSGNEALFVGAALTATSVGITARVFGDLKALASVEARTVLGAAVADDVIGLVILTVVVRLVTVGSISAVDVGQVVLVAVVFLVGASLLGSKLAPPAFDWLARVSKSNGTLVAVALAFTLGLAALAEWAKLAPIVGAFVAGVALSRAKVAPRIHRELMPVGHLLIPVFFLQIGVDADVTQFAKPAVLGLAAALFAVAVIGKLVSAAGMIGSPGDRLLVGMAMIPRGEVGLIFATIGLQQKVFGEDVYASVLLVVLATTLVTPPLLRWRLQRTGARHAEAAAPDSRPDGGWITTTHRAGITVVDLAAEPPANGTLQVALQVAVALADDPPGPRVLDWLSAQERTPLRWDPDSRSEFFRLLDAGGPRSWRFLSITGVLERALPELAEVVAEREAESYGFDPMASLDWTTLQVVHDLRAGEDFGLDHGDRVALAAVISDATELDATRSVVVARRVAQRLDLGAAAEEALAGMLRDLELFVATARRIDGLGEERVQQLAEHLQSAEQVTALLVLALATHPDDRTLHQRLRSLHERLTEALSHPELVSRSVANLLEIRRTAAARLTTDQHVQDRIASAPRAFVLTQTPAALAAQAALGEQHRRGAVWGVDVVDEGDGAFRVDVAAADQHGLLAHLARALASADLDVRSADLGVWDDGAVVASFRVQGDADPQVDQLVRLIEDASATATHGRPRPRADVSWDDQMSPWHTICRVTDIDEVGLLADLAAALSVAGCDIHAVHAVSSDGRTIDSFDLTDGHGAKLDTDTRRQAEMAIAGGSQSATRPRRFSLRGR